MSVAPIWDSDRANTHDGAWNAACPLFLEANAGTGKTYSLVRIAARLVVEKQIPLESLVILTYTTKAAAEMKSRLHQHLVERLGQTTSDEVRVLLERALNQLPWANVSTIHSFCLRLIRQNPDVFGFYQDWELESPKGASANLVNAFLRRTPLPTDCGGHSLDDVSLNTIRVRVSGVLGHDLPLLKYYDYVPRREGAPGREVAQLQRSLAVAADREWAEYFRQSRRVTYPGMIRLVGDRLVDQKFLERMRAQFRACIVDEFQDTDLFQWDILRKVFLREGVPLVLIGDPKQSIYAFRGADLRVYHQAREEIGRGRKGVVARLGTNFRSEPALLEAVNRVSRALFENTGQGWGHLSYPEESWSAPCARQDLKLRWAQDGMPAFGFLRVPHWSSSSGVDALRKAFTDCVAAKIRDLVGKPVVDRGQKRDLLFGDFVVLVHTNEAAQDVYLRLESLGIPAVLLTRGELWRGPAARGILYLFRFLERPSDTNRRRALLQSFWCHASPQDIENDRSPINVALESRLPLGLRLFETHQYPALLEWVGGWSSNWPQGPLSQRLGRRLLTDLYQIVDHVIEAADSRAFEAMTPSEWVEAMMSTTSEASEPEDLRLDRSGQAVRLMTLHSSKGLEFPVVFLMYGLSGKEYRYVTEEGVAVWRGEAEGRERGYWTYASGAGDLDALDLPKDSWKTGFLRDEELARKRLWYVGLTRAQLACFVAGMTSKNALIDRELFEPLGGLNRIEQDFTVETIAVPREGLPKQEDWIDEVWKRTHKPFRRASFDRAVITSYSTQSRESRRRLSRETEEVIEREADEVSDVRDELGGSWFGDLFHRAMQAWEWCGKDRKAAAAERGPIVRRLAQDLVPFQYRERLETVVHAVERMMETSVDTVLWPPGHSQGFTLRTLVAEAIRKEIPFLVRRDRNYLKGVIDALVVEGGRWYVIDYKTNQLDGYDQRELRRAMEEHDYTLQASYYATAVRQHLGPAGAAAFGGCLYLFVRGLESGGVYFTEGTDA